MQDFIKKNPGKEHYLLGQPHGEFDTEIRMNKIFPQNMRFDTEFIPSLKVLKEHGFIVGELNENYQRDAEFVVNSLTYLQQFVEHYSIDYYFQQHL